MKIHLLLLLCFHIFEAINGLEDFGGADIASPNVVTPQIVQPYSPNQIYLNNGIDEQQYYPNSPCQTICDSQGENCRTDCGSYYKPCPGYCNQAPSLCNSGCQQQQQIQQSPQTVTVQVPVKVARTVPETITRTVQKIARRVKVDLEFDVIRQCPLNYKMVEDETDIKRCVEDESSDVSCPTDYELRNERCVRTIVTCPNEYTRSPQNCTLRVVCPRNYQVRGDECIPPEPQCPYSWHWNGRVCEPERSTCPSGYILSSENRCTHEIQKCPPNYRAVGNQCVKEQPRCSPDFRMDVSTNVCVKNIKKCPEGSFEQYGECVSITYECPSGARESDNYCIFEETVQKVVYDVKYVSKTITMPGTVTSKCNGNYPEVGCGSQCTSNCAGSI